MLNDRIEAAIQRHICSAAVQGPAPTGLHKAIDYSVFPGGARIRPVILTSVAMASVSYTHLTLPTIYSV